MAASSEATSTTNISWQHSLPIISEAINADDYSLVCTHTSRILKQSSKAKTSSSNDGSTATATTTSIPNDVWKTLQLIHCRSLIHLSKYKQVLDYCTDLQNNQPSSSSSSSTSTQQEGQQQRSALALEEAYAIYKLGRYLKCRDFIIKKQKQHHDSTSEEGLMHILAQCHYRLHETAQASQTYTALLSPKRVLSDEAKQNTKDEIMTNAVAVHVANSSPPTSSCTILQSLSNTGGEEDLDQTIQNSLKESLLRKDETYSYELAYNYATHLLLTSSSLSQTKKAMEFLTDAEQECTKRDDDDMDTEGTEDGTDASERQKREEEIERNVMPIQANLALGKLMCSDWNGAARAYLQLVITAKQQQHGIGVMSNGGGGALMAAENNLAVLNLKRGSSCSVFDLLKKVPNVAYDGIDGHASTTNNNVNNSRGGLSRTTPNQVRILLYNRALLLYKMAKFTECKSVLNHLSKALSTDAEQHYQEQQKVNAKKMKRKKSKGGGRSGDGENIVENANSQQNPQQKATTALLPAPPTNEAYFILWQCRIALLESEIVRSQEGDAACNDADAIVAKMLETVTIALKAASGNKNSNIQRETLEYALAELMLHNFHKTTTKSSMTKSSNTSDAVSEEYQKEMISALENLPGSIRSRPATIATLSALYGNLGMDDKLTDVLDATSGSGMAQKSLADFKLRLGSYEEAVSLYESIILAVKEEKMSLSESEVLECNVGLVKALSYYDIQRADELASTVLLKAGKSTDEIELDGEALEVMDIPRLSKNSGMVGSSRRNDRGVNDSKKKNKKNQEAILRQRAKKREIYLEKLQKEGRYNPDRPTKPDPERWIPKNQRSYAKRGRKARQKFVGAQGGGTGAGAEKDAARLDAFARAAARAEGKDAFTQQPSTAHLSVSSNNGKGARRR